MPSGSEIMPPPASIRGPTAQPRSITFLSATSPRGWAMPPLTHAFTHFALTMHPVRVRVHAVQPSVNMPGVRWFDVDAALAAAVPSAVRRLIRSLDTPPSRLS